MGWPIDVRSVLHCISQLGEWKHAFQIITNQACPTLAGLHCKTCVYVCMYVCMFVCGHIPKI